VAVWVVLWLLINAGFALGVALIRRGQIRINRAICVAVAVWCAGWLLFGGERVWRLGTFREFETGRAPWWTDDRTFVRAFAITMTIWIGALAACLIKLLREDRSVPS
jgi:hypothetical protein